MPSVQELPPVTPERLATVAQWLETHVQPVMHAAAEAKAADAEPVQEFETRDYQIEAWARLDIAREAERTRALGNLATGLGKTFVAAVDVMRYREWCAAQQPPIIPRILYVSHRNDISEQAAPIFKTLMPDATIDFFATRRESLPDADFTFATIQSLYSELDRFDPQDFEYIIWDESHHLEARTFKVVRDYFDPLFEHAITATIKRMDGKDIQTYFGEPLYQKTLPEGIAEGHLVDVDYHIVFDEQIKEALQEGFDPKTIHEIRKLFARKPSLESMARSIQREKERLGLKDPKTIIFCENTNEADRLARLLGGSSYHYKTKHKKEVLKNFRRGTIRLLTTCDKLNEGVDVPDAELLIFSRITNSPSVFDQQLGRGLRKAPGKTKVTVLDFVANIERIIRVQELSREVRRYTAYLIEDALRESGIESEESDDKIPRVNVRHGSFDFDVLAVDLLAKLRSIRERAANAFNALTNEQLVTLALTINPDRPLHEIDLNSLAKDGRFLDANAIRARFTSVLDFHRECGFNPSEHGKVNLMSREKDITPEKIVARALELSPSKPLTADVIKRLSKAKKFWGEKIIKRHFGSVPDFQRACGFNAARSEVVDKDADTAKKVIVAKAKQLKPDGPLTSPEIAALSKARKFVSIPTVLKYFDSIPDFQRECGFEPTGKSSYKNKRKKN